MNEYTFKQGKKSEPVKIKALNVLFALDQYVTPERIGAGNFNERAMAITATLRLCREDANIKEWVVSKCGKSVDPAQNIVFISALKAP